MRNLTVDVRPELIVTSELVRHLHPDVLSTLSGQPHLVISGLDQLLEIINSNTLLVLHLAKNFSNWLFILNSLELIR